MKTHKKSLAVIVLFIALLPAGAQRSSHSGRLNILAFEGALPSGPPFGAYVEKILGETSAFSAALEIHTSDHGTVEGELTIPGKLAYLDGKSRFEVDITKMKMSKIGPWAASVLTDQGVDHIITISRPDKKIDWVIYPGWRSYVENKVRDAATAKSLMALKIAETKLGEETLEDHSCVKSRLVLTDKTGETHEFTVWHAMDLRNFPIKIEIYEPGGTDVGHGLSADGRALLEFRTRRQPETTTFFFRDVKLEKPNSAQFKLSDHYTKYTDLETMRAEAWRKRVTTGVAPGRQ